MATDGSVFATAAIHDELVEITADLIRGRGENPGETEAESVRRLAEHCRSIGAEVTLSEVAPGRENLHAVLGNPDGPRYLFLGHSDVVPAGNGWTGDPFEPRLIDGYIVGRGSTDMKSGLAASVIAMREIIRARPDLCVELLCTVDEESLTTGVRHYIQTTEPQNYEALIVAEPTNLEVVIGCRGATNFSIVIEGASAHAGRPSDGASAIHAAAEIIQVVQDLAIDEESIKDAVIGNPTWNVGLIEGGTGTSMVAQECRMSIDRRTLPVEHPRAILDDLLDRVEVAIRKSWIANSERLHIYGTVDMVMPGFLTDIESDLVAAATNVMGSLGYPAEPTGWTAACEGGYLSAHHDVPTIILGPGDINTQAHQPDERVATADIVTASRAYFETVLQLAGTKQT